MVMAHTGAKAAEDVLARLSAVFPRENNPTYEAPVAFACSCFKRIRKEPFSGVITIWVSRASHPIAQSKVGSFPFTAFFSSLRDCSPLVLSASQISPAVLPISSSIMVPFLRTVLTARIHT
jgi:hypothetical protein